MLTITRSRNNDVYRTNEIEEDNILETIHIIAIYVSPACLGNTTDLNRSNGAVIQNGLG